MKLFKLTAFLFITLNALVVKAAFGSSPPEKNQSPNVVEPEKDVPVCYIQTTNNRNVNLSRLCNQPPKDSKVNSAPTPTPYNFPAIKKFNDEVYGKDN